MSGDRIQSDAVLAVTKNRTDSYPTSSSPGEKSKSSCSRKNYRKAGLESIDGSAQNGMPIVEPAAYNVNQHG